MLCAYKWSLPHCMHFTLHNVAEGSADARKEECLTYKTNIHLQILESYKMCIIAPEFSSIFNTILLYVKQSERHKFLLEWFARIYMYTTGGIAKTYWHSS